MPKPVEVVNTSEEVYTLQDFEEVEPQDSDLSTSVTPDDLPEHFLETLSSSMRKRITEGSAREKNRSIQEFSTARSLLARGLTVGQVLTVFLNPDWGIGSKTQEKGPSYAVRTILKAQEANEKEGIRSADHPEAFDTLADLVEALHWFESDGGSMKRRKEVDPDSDFTGPCMKWLRDHGMDFLRDDRTDDGYVFWSGRIIPADKDSRQMKDLIYELAGVTETSWDNRKLRESIAHEARVRGRGVILHPWIAFDVERCQGYLLPDAHAGELLIFGPGGVAVEPNGTDGYLLRPTLLGLPLKYDESVDKTNGLRELVGSLKPFFATTVPAQQLLTCYLLTIPLQAFSASDLLPILHVTGPSGGGKSWALKLMTSWFYGRALLLRATQASSYAISDADPFLALDDYETLDADWQGRLLTGATGLVRTKMGGANMSRAVLQEGTVSFALTSINPLPTETLRRRAMVVDVDAKVYSTEGFNPTTAINRLVASRDRTWSAYIKLLAEDVLPAMVAGSSADNIKRVQDIIEVPENKGLATYLSLMWLIAENVGKYVDDFCPDDFETTMGAWADAMRLQSTEEFSERDTLLTLIELTYDELKRAGENYAGHLDVSPLISSSGRLIGFEGTGTQLYGTFAVVSRNKGLKFEMTSPNAVGRRFQLAQRVLDRQGWVAEAKKFGPRRGWTVTRADLVKPEEIA